MRQSALKKMLDNAIGFSWGLRNGYFSIQDFLKKIDKKLTG